MIQSDWYREVEIAADWWKDQIIIVQYRPHAGSVESTDDGN